MELLFWLMYFVIASLFDGEVRPLCFLLFLLVIVFIAALL